ncbi:MAG: fumarylacetoacetate (FAA) hydrolase, partial [Gammaproteobacteria bacterium]
MKLASLKEGGRDGTLIVVNRAVTQAVKVTDIAKTMQMALDDWAAISPKLEGVYTQLQKGQISDVFDLDPNQLAAPLPRSY